MLRSGDAVSPGLKSRKITGLSPNHGQITTLLDRLQFVGDKLGTLLWLMSFADYTWIKKRFVTM